MAGSGLRVLLLDSSVNFPSNPLFAEALEDLARDEGHSYHFLDDAPFFGSLGTTPVHRLIRRVAGHPLTVGAFNRHITDVADAFRPDVAVVVKGAYVSVETLAGLRRNGTVLVNVATDDPFSAASTATPWVREGIPCYDLYCSTKRAVIPDIRSAGCDLVTFLPCGYKPTVHFPETASTAEEMNRFSCDVLFVGAADPDRVPYLLALVQAIPGLRLHLYGGYWERYPGLRQYTRGFVRGREYRIAISGAKIVVNLVRRMNRDGHVMRSFEVPACKGFMLAERTAEHSEFLAEDREMVCFGSTEELIGKVRTYLPLADRRLQIAEAGHARIVGERNTYRDRLETILETIGPLLAGRRTDGDGPGRPLSA